MFRNYFLRSTKFKKRVRLLGSMDPKVRSTYLNMALPKFVWITEVTTFKLYSADQTILGEIIFDSTANKMAVNDTILSIHLPGYLLVNSDLSKDPVTETEIEVEEPYSIYQR